MRKNSPMANLEFTPETVVDDSSVLLLSTTRGMNNPRWGGKLKEATLEAELSGGPQAPTSLLPPPQDPFRRSAAGLGTLRPDP